MKVLALTLHRKGRSPGQRYRFEQYLTHFEDHSILFKISPLLKSKKDDEIFYGSGNLISKSIVGLIALFRRVLDLMRARRYDYVFIFRDAFFFGTFFERTLKTLGCKLIYDFDDAIWLKDENPNQGVFNKLKNPGKVATICKLADVVIVGNEYLKKYAEQFNDNVRIIPSTIDFSDYGKASKKQHEGICIGWTGSFSTIKHFETILPALEQIKTKYKDKVYFKLIGDPDYVNSLLDIKGHLWNAETEAEDLSELDIGIMPLPDNEWTRGKCAMKGLQYMALEIPTIMSPVGVNSDIIEDGENGCLAGSTEEWVEKLSRLIESEPLRKRIGEAGRKTVERDFSAEANKDKWLAAFRF